jgi:predicted nucleic acid-binding protein
MPADSAYIDTSVLGAYYCPEDLSAAAETALRAIRTPVISLLSEVEFSSLIARKRRLGELSERQAKAILELFSTHVAEGSYRRISVTTEHFLKARQLIDARPTELRTLDALHLSIAVTEKLALVTADQGLAKAAKRHKSVVVLVK